MKTSELIGPALDWAVAKCEGVPLESYLSAVAWMKRREPSDDELSAQHAYQYSTGWAQGGPIIEREDIATECTSRANSTWSANTYGWGKRFRGPTLLIAAMRCFVASKLGDEVDVPKELR